MCLVRPTRIAITQAKRRARGPERIPVVRPRALPAAWSRSGAVVRPWPALWAGSSQGQRAMGARRRRPRAPRSKPRVPARMIVSRSSTTGCRLQSSSTRAASARSGRLDHTGRDWRGDTRTRPHHKDRARAVGLAALDPVALGVEHTLGDHLARVVRRPATTRTRNLLDRGEAISLVRRARLAPHLNMTTAPLVNFCRTLIVHLSSSTQSDVPVPSLSTRARTWRKSECVRVVCSGELRLTHSFLG